MKFDLGTVLSITTERLFTKIDNVYKILNYMTGDNLFTHQLPRAGRACKSPLLEQFPILKEVTGDDITKDNWQEKLQSYIEKYGNKFDVIPLTEWQHKNPIIEAIEMRRGIDG